jgi:hypothetical protein
MIKDLHLKLKLGSEMMKIIPKLKFGYKIYSKYVVSCAIEIG